MRSSAVGPTGSGRCSNVRPAARLQQFTDSVAMRMAAMTAGTVTRSIDPENVEDDASLGVVGGIEGAFECVATGSVGATCIQSGVENMVRAAFYG